MVIPGKQEKGKIRRKIHIIRSQVQITFQNGPKSSEVSKWLLECNRNINGKKILWEMCFAKRKIKQKISPWLQFTKYTK